MSAPSDAPEVAQVPFIPLSVPHLSGNEWEYVKDCLDTNWVSSAGTYVGRFEAMLAETAGTRHAVAVQSGTAALHVALAVAGVGRDDEVLIPSLTFVASANAVAHAGAVPVFVDCEPVYRQMDPDLIAAFLADNCERAADGSLRNRRSGRRVAALMPVHVFGDPADMDRLAALAAEHGIAVVEDATEALGTRCSGRPAGSIGLLGCFSFNGNKLITTGGGGMIVTDDEALAKRARHLTTQARSGGAEYVHDEVGYNYRLTNIQAALGCAQMERLAHYLATKKRIAEHYDAAFADDPRIAVPARASWADSNHWLYTVRLRGADFETSRALIRGLAERRIEARPVWQPLHQSPAYNGAETLGGAVADEIYTDSVSLPSSVTLEPADQNRVIDAVRSITDGIGPGRRTAAP